MTSRQRVLAAIAHQEPDRVPFNLRPDPEITARFRQEFGDGDFAEHFGHDVRYVGYALPDRPVEVPEVGWTPTPDEQAIAAAEAATRALHDRGLAVCGAYYCGVFEQAKRWLGEEATMVAPYENPSEFRELLERITEWKMALYGAYVTAGVDIVWMGDDLGTQRSLVMSPEQYREWYRPCHQQIVQRLRSLRQDVRIAFHCCGHVTPLIPDLIESGIDILVHRFGSSPTKGHRIASASGSSHRQLHDGGYPPFLPFQPVFVPNTG